MTKATKIGFKIFEEQLMKSVRKEVFIKMAIIIAMIIVVKISMQRIFKVCLNT